MDKSRICIISKKLFSLLEACCDGVLSRYVSSITNGYVQFPTSLRPEP